jgi:hypothetical protein
MGVVTIVGALLQFIKTAPEKIVTELSGVRT